jgi:F0F1-type ATP synthase assembly protein I
MSRINEGAAWTILGYLISGPWFWGGIGWGLDKWLVTGYFLPIGLLLGMGAALYLVWLRFGREG